MKYAITYASQTGNTKLLAETIRSLLPPENLICFGVHQDAAQAADRLCIGFWTDKGTCDGQSAAFLKTLRNREVFLFGTAGFGRDPDYYSRILSSVCENMDSSVTIFGSFMCQGKMPMTVRHRYEKMMADNATPHLEAMIENFDRALSHPDAQDLQNLREKVSHWGL